MLISNHCKKYQCSICHQKYSKIEEIRAHIKATHLVHVTCPLCDKLFANKIELLKHKKLHFQVTPENISEQSEGIQASKVKGKESDRGLSSSSSREDAEVGPPDNHCKVKPNCSSPCHANDSEYTISEMKCTPDQDSSFNQVFSGAHLLFKDRNSQTSIFSDNLPHQREENTNNCSPNENEGGEHISLSASTEKICVPLGDHWKNTSTGATSKESETSADELTCADKQGASISVGSETYVIIPYKETKYVQLPEYIGIAKCDSQKPKEYNCNVCNKTYDNIESVQSHIKEVHVNILICLLCNEKFSTRSQYLSHSNSHLDGSSALLEGRELHNGNLEEDSSEGIEKAIPSKTEMGVASPGVGKRKSSKSGKAKEYKCKLCQEKYVCIEDIRTHIKKVHLAGLTCTLCDKIFENKYSLIDHAKAHFGEVAKSNSMQSDDSNGNCSKMLPKIGEEEDGVYLDKLSTDCNVCDSAAGECESYSGGQNHGDECYKCDNCILFFDTATALTLHQKTHKKVLYKCGVCEFASSSKKSVIAHLSQERHSFQDDFSDDLS